MRTKQEHMVFYHFFPFFSWLSLGFSVLLVYIMKKNNKNSDFLSATDCAIDKNQKMLYSNNMNNKEKQIRLKLLMKRLNNVDKVCTMYPKNTMFQNSQIIKKMNNKQNLYFNNNYKEGQTLCQK